jgi:hypothetical protein
MKTTLRTGLCGLVGALGLATTSNARAYGFDVHSGMVDTAWQVMVLVGQESSVAFTTRPPPLTTPPDGADPMLWSQFLSELGQSVVTYPALTTGLRDPRRPANRCDDVYPPFEHPSVQGGLAECRLNQVTFAPSSEYWRGDAGSCGVNFRYRNEGVFGFIDAGFTGTVLGYHAAAVDHDYDDTQLDIRWSSSLGLNTAINGLVEANITAAVLPFVCAYRIIGSGDLDCFDDATNLAEEYNPYPRLETMFPATEAESSDRTAGMWHYMNVDYDAPRFDDIGGLYYEQSGPNGEIGIFDLYLMIGGDATGLVLNAEKSNGTRRYNVDGPNATDRRDNWEWEAYTIGHTDFSPLDNLAEWGETEFTKDPSDVGPLGRPLHALGDVVVPMHVVSATGWGHQPFEDATEQVWKQVRFLEDPPPAGLVYSESDKHAQFEQARRILHEGFRWWAFLRGPTSPDGRLPIRNMITAMAHETRALGVWSYSQIASVLYHTFDMNLGAQLVTALTDRLGCDIEGSGAAEVCGDAAVLTFFPEDLVNQGTRAIAVEFYKRQLQGLRMRTERGMGGILGYLVAAGTRGVGTSNLTPCSRDWSCFPQVPDGSGGCMACFGATPITLDQQCVAECPSDRPIIFSEPTGQTCIASCDPPRLLNDDGHCIPPPVE